MLIERSARAGRVRSLLPTLAAAIEWSTHPPSLATTHCSISPLRRPPLLSRRSSLLPGRALQYAGRARALPSSSRSLLSVRLSFRRRLLARRSSPTSWPTRALAASSSSSLHRRRRQRHAAAPPRCCQSACASGAAGPGACVHATRKGHRSARTGCTGGPRHQSAGSAQGQGQGRRRSVWRNECVRGGAARRPNSLAAAWQGAASSATVAIIASSGYGSAGVRALYPLGLAHPRIGGCRAGHSACASPAAAACRSRCHTRFAPKAQPAIHAAAAIALDAAQHAAVLSQSTSQHAAAIRARTYVAVPARRSDALAARCAHRPRFGQDVSARLAARCCQAPSRCRIARGPEKGARCCLVIR